MLLQIKIIKKYIIVYCFSEKFYNLLSRVFFIFVVSLDLLIIIYCCSAIFILAKFKFCGNSQEFQANILPFKAKTGTAHKFKIKRILTIEERSIHLPPQFVKAFLGYWELIEGGYCFELRIYFTT